MPSGSAVPIGRILFAPGCIAFFGHPFVQLGERLMNVNLCLRNMTSSALAIVLVVGLVASADAQKILFDLGDGRLPQRQRAQSD